MGRASISSPVARDLTKCVFRWKWDYGITYEKIERQNGVFWPCPSEEHPGTETFRERLPPGWKSQISRNRARATRRVPDEEFPLILTSGRVVYHTFPATRPDALASWSSNVRSPR
jgi:predicted molibdopterin-dependent oxidoreductase YjgC